MEKPLDFKNMNAIKSRMAEYNRKKYESDSKNRLCNIIETKVKTSFIGAISQFEENFGFLWGHGQSDELEEDQKLMKEIWEKTRTHILNNGNNQIRAASNEIELYTINWERHTMELPVKPIKETEEEK